MRPCTCANSLHGSRRAKAQSVSVHVSFHLHVIHDVLRLSVRWSFLVSLSPVSLLLQPLLFHTLPVVCPALHPCRHRRGLKPLHSRRMRSIAPWRKTILSQVMSPSSSSETSAMIFQEESGDIDTEPSYSCDAELDDEIIGKALSSPLFTQEREEPANRRQAYHSHEEILLPAHSFSVCHSRTVKPVHELSSLSSCNSEKPSREMENETIRILVERQKEQLLVDFRVEIQKHEFQADHDRRSIHELRVSAKRNWHFCTFEIICELL